MRFAVFGPLLLAGAARAHLAVFHKAMYCFNGTISGVVNLNNDAPVTPLWALPKSQWWFHHVNGCDQFPPAPGDFLELPAGGSFTVEIASNRGKTSLSFNSQYVSDWPDGANHPNDYSAKDTGGIAFPASGCIPAPNMHTQNQSMAAGTAFAISYTSDLTQVTSENLAVFTVAYNTPWKRLTTYQVPAAMPACPKGGCICAWGWVPNGCGEPNMYMQGFKCNVTGATSTTPVATAKPAVWCEDNVSKCVSGAKQLIYWNQAEGNNIQVSGNDLSGWPRSPAYNNKLGFSNGAQNDIFGPSSNTNLKPADNNTSSHISSSTSSSSSSSKSTPYPSKTTSIMTSSTCKSKSKMKARQHRRRLPHF